MNVRVFSFFFVILLALGQLPIGLTSACGQVGISIGDGEKKEPLKGEYVQNELLVKFKAGISTKNVTEIHAQLGTKVVHVLADGLLYQLQLPPSASLEEVKKAYEARPEVEYVEVNYVVGIDASPISKP